LGAGGKCHCEEDAKTPFYSHAHYSTLLTSCDPADRGSMFPYAMTRLLKSTAV
jgi:hypothetical protein